MKKLTGFLILLAILFISIFVCSAESGIELYWEGNTYTIDEAAASNGAIPFKVVRGEGVTELSDASAGIKATIKVDTLNEESFQALRDYYNDKKSTGDQLFEKYIKLQRSYIPAAQDLFRTSYLYGEQDDPASEYNMKLFYEGSDTLFGQESAVYMYNIFSSDKLIFNEETHIDLSIPVNATHTLISMGITVKSGSLNKDSTDRIMALLGAIRLEGLLPQTGKLLLFGDKNVMDAANAGIYPSRQSKNNELLTLNDNQAGFSLSYPSGYVPYMQNSLGGRLQFRSFKIDPNHVFSISSERLEPGTTPESAVEAVITLEGRDNISEESRQEINGQPFNYVKYETATTGGAIYISDYFTENDSTLYKLELSSRFEEPSSLMLEDFSRILESFSTQKLLSENPTDTPALDRYINNGEGYSFGYPGDWELTDASENISYDRLRLIFPNLSGALNVTVSEGELFNEITPRDLPSFITGQSSKEADSNVKSYKQPFDGSQTKLLNISYRLEGSTIYTYRLMDYLDSNGRNRLAYCIDIFKGKKIYSMFIAIGEYETENGRILDEHVNSVVNAIASSFRIENTAESDARAAAGETRNRKVVFIEDWLKANTDPWLKVGTVENTAADGSIYLRVVSGETGYYRVKPDFENGTLQVLDRTLDSTILNSELDKLKETYKDRIITDTHTDVSSMSISINSRKDKSSPVSVRTYHVDVSLTENGVTWETVRANHAEELMRDCAVYMSFIFSADINMNFSDNNVFKDIETYEKNNVMYHTLVHVQFNDIDGYFILEVDPSNDDIRLIYFKSIDMLAKDIDEKYGYIQNGYEIADSSINGDNFTLKLTLKSKADGSEKTENIKIRYNKKDIAIDY